MSVSFTTTIAEGDIITSIVDRAASLAKQHTRPFDRMSCRMDICATHANGNPLRLQDLLDADDFNFAHDVFGIEHHIDRETGKMERFFSPRFSAPQPITVERS